jgi:hypothetical protein
MSLRLLTVDKMNAIEFEIVEDDDLEVLDFIENGLPRQIYVRQHYFEDLDEGTFRRRFRLTKKLCISASNDDRRSARIHNRQVSRYLCA